MGVAHQADAVRLAPAGECAVVDLALALQKQLVIQPCIVVFPAVKQGGEVGGVAARMAENLGKAVRPREHTADIAPQNTRLIGEKAAHFAEILSQHRLVYRVGGAQKCLHHLAVQGVHIEGVDLVVEMAVFAAHGDVGNGVRRMYRRRGGGAAQILLLIFFAQSVHSAAAEAARPAVFVISPGEHAAPAAFLQCCAHIGKPVCREILGLQTATGVHEIAAHAGLVHLAHLRSRFLRLQSLIPRPKGRRTAFFRRVLQGFFPVFHGVFLRFAENLTISCYHTVFSKAIGECPKN